jgi:DNA topoisomerase-3
MESVDKFIDDARLKEILRRKEKAGIGTDATRPEVIETLIRRGYVRRKKQYLQVTPLASQLIASIPATLSDPATTALWEFELERIADGCGDVAMFLHQQRNAVSEHVAAIRKMASVIGEQLSAAVTAAPVQPRQGIRNASRASAKSSDGVSHDTGTATKKGAGAPCPECGHGELVRRSVKHGKNAGRSFLGCTRYPTCKHFEWARDAS